MRLSQGYTTAAAADLENERLVEDRVQRLAMNLRLELSLLVRHDVDLDVRIGRPTHVHCRQLGRLDYSDSQLHAPASAPAHSYQHAATGSPLNQSIDLF